MMQKKIIFFALGQRAARRCAGGGGGALTGANVEPVRVHGRQLLVRRRLGVVDVLGQADLAAALQVLGKRHDKRLRIHVVH